MGLDNTDLSAEDLSGPVVDSETTQKLLDQSAIDRRTAMKAMASAGAAGLAGCMGGDKGGKGTEAATTTQGNEGGGGGTDTSKNQKSKKYGGRLTAGWYADVINVLDPMLAPQSWQIQVQNIIFSSLISTTPKLKVVGDLAKDWKTPDAQTWTFNIREDAYWQRGYEGVKGKNVTAHDFKYTYKRAMNLQGSLDKSTFADIKGEYGSGGMEVLDDYKLRFTLEKPLVPALILFGTKDWVCKGAVEELSRGEHKLRPVGSGPFKVTKHELGQGVVLDRHSKFYRTDDQGNQLPYLDGVDIKPIPEASTLINALKTGGVDFVNSIPRPNVPSVEKAQNVEIQTPPAAGWVGLEMNCLREPFTDPKTRRGIAKSINSKEFVKQAFLGYNEPAIGPVPPAHGAYYRKPKNKPDYQNYDPEKGKQMLKETGAYNASVSILTPKMEIRQAKVMKNQLDDVLDVSIESVPGSVSRSRISPTKHDFDMGITGAGNDLTLFDWLYEMFRPPEAHPDTEKSGGIFNNMMYYDPWVTEMVDKVRTMTDKQKRIKTVQKIEDKLMKDAPLAFTHHSIPYQASKKRVQGYEAHVQDRELVDVWLKNAD